MRNLHAIKREYVAPKRRRSRILPPTDMFTGAIIGEWGTTDWATTDIDWNTVTLNFRDLNNQVRLTTNQTIQFTGTFTANTDWVTLGDATLV